MRGHVVLLQELGFQRRGQLVKSSARVREFGVAAVARWWKSEGTQEGEGGPAWVERRVDVEKRVTL
jgi:hypothetical protein